MFGFAFEFEFEFESKFEFKMKLFILRVVGTVGIIFYPPKPHRSSGTEIEF